MEVKKIEFIYDFVKGNICIFEGNAIFVQDINEQQNSQLFAKGIEMIDKLVPSRKAYLQVLFNTMLPSDKEDAIVVGLKSKELYRLIAFVCDIALHYNKKLAHPQAYDKDFKKYVANLFYHYYIDDSYTLFKKTGVVSYVSIKNHIR